MSTYVHADQIVSEFAYWTYDETASNTHVSSGGILHTEATMINTVVHSGGEMYLSGSTEPPYETPGAVASGLQVLSGGFMSMYSGATLAGEVVFGGSIAFNPTAEFTTEELNLTIDLTGHHSNSFRGITHLGFLGADDTVAISVAADQMEGRYALAGSQGWDDDREVTLKIADYEGDPLTLTVGGEAVEANNTLYRLFKDDYSLYLRVGDGFNYIYDEHDFSSFDGMSIGVTLDSGVFTMEGTFDQSLNLAITITTNDQANRVVAGGAVRNGEIYFPEQFIAEGAYSINFTRHSGSGTFDFKLSGTQAESGAGQNDWNSVKSDLEGLAEEFRFTVDGSTAAEDTRKTGWVGAGFPAAAWQVTIDAPANLAFSFSADSAAVMTVYQITGDTVQTLKVKSLKAVSVTGKETAAKEFSHLFKEAGEYYVVISTTNLKSGSAVFDFSIDGTASKFYDHKDSSADDDWTDRPQNDLAFDFQVLPDMARLDGWVGLGDEIDFRKLVVAESGNFTFALSATGGKAQFIFYERTGAPGKYSLKTLKTVNVAADGTDEFKTLLTGGGDYYLAVKSPDAKTGGWAEYGMSVDGNFFAYNNAQLNDAWGLLTNPQTADTLPSWNPLLEDELSAQYVGYGNEWDYLKLDAHEPMWLDLSFTLTDTALSDKVQFTVYELVESKGKYSLKSLKSVTVNGSKENGKTLEMLLDKPAATYVLGVKSANAAKGAYTQYGIQSNSLAFVYEPAQLNDAWGLLTNPQTADTLPSWNPLLEDELSAQYVGYGNEWDYLKLSDTVPMWLDLSFTLTDTALSDKLQFTVYELVESKGKYSLKSLKSVTVNGSKENGKTLEMLLDKPAATYVLGVKSANAAKGAYTQYEVQSNSSLFDYAPSQLTDDWALLTSEQTAGTLPSWKLQDGSQLVAEGNDSRYVGYNNVVDYYRLDLSNAASLSLSLSAEGKVKFTVYELVESKGKYSLKSLKSVTVNGPKENGKTLAALLDNPTATYVLAVESVDAKKGAYVSYNCTEQGSKFFANANAEAQLDNWPAALRKQDGVGALPQDVLLEEVEECRFGGWVGFGDTVDFAGFTVETDGTYDFNFLADDKSKLTVYELTGTTGNYRLKTLKSVAVTTASVGGTAKTIAKVKLMADTQYIIGVESTNAKQGGSASYQVAFNCDLVPA